MFRRFRRIWNQWQSVVLIIHHAWISFNPSGNTVVYINQTGTNCPKTYLWLPVIYELWITIRNSVNKVKNGFKLPVSTGLAPNHVTKTNTVKRLKQKRNTFGLCLKLMGLYYKIGDIQVSGIRSVQSISRNVSISRPPGIAFLSVCLSVEGSAKLCRTASRDSHINSPQYHR